MGFFVCFFSETLYVFFAATLKLHKAEPQMERVYHFGQDLRSESVSRSGTWDLPGPGIEPCFPHWQADSWPPNHQESPEVLNS